MVLREGLILENKRYVEKQVQFRIPMAMIILVLLDLHLKIIQKLLLLHTLKMLVGEVDQLPQFQV